MAELLLGFRRKLGIEAAILPKKNKILPKMAGKEEKAMKFPKWMDDWDREKFNYDLLNPPQKMDTREASLWLVRIKRGMQYDLIMGLVSETNYQKFLHELEALNEYQVSAPEIEKIIRPVVEYFYE